MVEAFFSMLDLYSIQEIYQSVLIFFVMVGSLILFSRLPKRKKRGGRANKKTKKQNKISTRENDQARLEQLKVLRDAGLYTDQEYETKRQEILKKQV